MSDFVTSCPTDVTIPPPHIRATIEKTAQYVSKHGVAFENKIRNQERSGASKFTFINKDDPYNQYYRHVLDMLKRSVDSPVQRANGGLQQEQEQSLNQEQQQEQEQRQSVRVQNPFLTLTLDENYEPLHLEKEMTIPELNLLKLLAKYSAINGHEALVVVTAREEMKPHLGFLEKSSKFHILWKKYLKLFTMFVGSDKELASEFNQYQTRFIEKKGNSLRLKQQPFLEHCNTFAGKFYRARQSHSELQKRLERQRVAYASVDWQNFTIVETVIFDSDDNSYQKPVTKEALKYRELIKKDIFNEQQGDDEYNEQFSYADADADGEDQDAFPSYNEENDIGNNNDNTPLSQGQSHAAASPRVPKGMKIKAAGTSRLLKRTNDASATIEIDPKTGEKLLPCPLSAKLIPESKFQHHLNILLRDPKYKEEKKRYEEKFQFGDGLSSDKVWENITALVNGTTEAEGAKKARVVWDGHHSTAHMARLQAQGLVTPQEREKFKQLQIEKRNAYGPQREHQH